MFSVSIRLEQPSNDTVGSLASVNQHSPVQREQWMVTTSYLCSNHLHTSRYLVATYYPSYRSTDRTNVLQERLSR
jgi:hypothetical protein